MAENNKRQSPKIIIRRYFIGAESRNSVIRRTLTNEIKRKLRDKTHSKKE